jgi:hypothetical protein
VGGGGGARAVPPAFEPTGVHGQQDKLPPGAAKVLAQIHAGLPQGGGIAPDNDRLCRAHEHVWFQHKPTSHLVQARAGTGQAGGALDKPTSATYALSAAASAQRGSVEDSASPAGAERGGLPGSKPSHRFGHGRDRGHRQKTTEANLQRIDSASKQQQARVERDAEGRIVAKREQQDFYAQRLRVHAPKMNVPVARHDVLPHMLSHNLGLPSKKGPVAGGHNGEGYRFKLA